MKTGLPEALDRHEPENVAIAVEKLGLSHVVITSVDRDDLADGGASIFASDPRHPRAKPEDDDRDSDARFSEEAGALEVVVAAKPDVFNHNLELCRRTISPCGPARAISTRCACCNK